MDVEFTLKTVYGKEYYYPASPDAKTICKLINRPTLTIQHLRICKDAGWTVKKTHPITEDKEIII